VKPFLGFKITSKLQEGLDKSSPNNKFYFKDNNPDFLQIITIESDKYIGKVVEQGMEYKKIEDVCRNIISIINKLCPDIPFSIDAIKLHAINSFP
jgi:hypothetical protein